MTQAPAPAAQIEYTIYTYDMPTPKQKGDNSWKKHSTGQDMGKAMEEAEQLSETKKFQKVEVKKKFFDQKKNRTVDMTLKVFETERRKDYSILIITVLTVVAGLAAFAASFFFGKNS